MQSMHLLNASGLTVPGAQDPMGARHQIHHQVPHAGKMLNNRFSYKLAPGPSVPMQDKFSKEFIFHASAIWPASISGHVYAPNNCLCRFPNQQVGLQPKLL